ncbi:MAG TPA: YceI family protein [Solirubrobacterales bacterium]|nr:YceI family protein [Solirubrobacterales bacterium]
MATAQAESTIPAGTWQSDPVHSSVGFAVKHVVGTFRGSFNEFSATLSDTERTPKLSGRAKVESVHVSDEKLYSHLLSPEFFDAEQHPEIIFESNGIAVDGDQLAVDGELTVKGITKSVTARGEIAGPAPGPADTERVGIDLETIVDRHDFGLDWQMDLPGGGKTLGDDVTLTVHVELIKG